MPVTSSVEMEELIDTQSQQRDKLYRPRHSGAICLQTLLNALLLFLSISFLLFLYGDQLSSSIEKEPSTKNATVTPISSSILPEQERVNTTKTSNATDEPASVIFAQIAAGCSMSTSTRMFAKKLLSLHGYSLKELEHTEILKCAKNPWCETGKVGINQALRNMAKEAEENNTSILVKFDENQIKKNKEGPSRHPSKGSCNASSQHTGSSHL